MSKTSTYNPTEHQEACVFADYLRARGIKFTHLAQETPAVRRTANGWERNHATLARLKREGVNRGFPDYVIMLPGGRGILFVELKRRKGGKVSPEQREWIDMLKIHPGIEARICRGADEAIAFVEEFYPQAR